MANFISVIIPVYKDWDRLQKCIDALLNQTISPSKFEVIIINNDPDGTQPLKTLPYNFRIILETKPGSYAARNAGIKLANGELLAFTDSDCIPNLDWLESGLKVFNADNNIQRVGGDIKLFFKKKKLTFAEIYEKAFSFKQESYVKDRNAAATANMWAKKELFKEVGYFNENLKSGGDMEWGERAYRLGYTIHFSYKVTVMHPARESIEELKIKAARVITGSQKVFGDQKTKGKNTWIIKSLFPPVFAAYSAYKNQNLTFREKIISTMVLYYLKLYKIYFILAIKLSLKRQPQEK